MPTGVNGTTCTAAEFELSQGQYPNIYCLTRGDSIGLSFSIQAGVLSILAVIILFMLIVRNVLRHRRYAVPGSWRLLKEPIDIYVLALFTLDLIQALGKVTNIRWVNTGKVVTGEYCTAQGAVSQFGETGVALTTTVITIHTVFSVFWRRGIHSRMIACAVVFLILVFVSLWVGIGIGTHKDPEFPFYAPTPFWCWIAADYPKERIGGEYLWLWTALITSIILYIPLFLWSQGNLSVHPEKWWHFRLHRRPPVLEFQGRRRRAFTILAYPMVYSIVILPVTIIRWVGFGLEARGISNGIPSVATFIVDYSYSLSGAMNVALLLCTRPNLLLFNSEALRRRDIETSMTTPKNIAHNRSSVTVGRRLPDEDGVGIWAVPISEPMQDTDSESLDSRSPHATSQ